MIRGTEVLQRCWKFHTFSFHGARKSWLQGTTSNERYAPNQAPLVLLMVSAREQKPSA